MEIFTIGFTQKSAAQFFDAITRADIGRLLDIRLNNTSQLAGFAKRDDLEYFLREICEAEYLHEPAFAPTKDILDAYKKGSMPWNEFAKRFRALLEERQAEGAVEKPFFDVPTVLLCSEPTAEHCHRRLVAEHLKKKWGDVKITHL